ncbi:MAG: aminotransferase class IV [Sphingobacteriales bacterium]|nr:aminotransferase class IV [Sphingobacteriales bacterium]MBI3718839.1 aminotransferase class IV [Sphingobacteriales bacterium]
MPEFYNYNGKICEAGDFFISPDNRGFRYGDGLFETMVVTDGKIRLADLHFDRLFSGMNLMRFEIPKLFTSDYFKDEILSLCKKNKLVNARVRLAVFRGDGGLYDAQSMLPNFVIQVWPLPDHVFQLNENGLVIDVYQQTRKQQDIFSNIKSANYLPYVMAALHAKENRLNDCLVLNSSGNVADASIANVFLLKDKILYTPSLTEGCVAGIMRRFLIENVNAIGLRVHEKTITVEEVEQADEVFLTNTTSVLRWVKQFKNKVYDNAQASNIYKRLMDLLNN